MTDNYHKTSFQTFQPRTGNKCGDCMHFELCRGKKNVNEKTEYCNWPPQFRNFKKKANRICKTCTEDCEFAGLVEMVSFCHKEKQVSEHRDMEGV